LKPDLVIAVNVSGNLTPAPPRRVFEIFMKTVEIMGNRLVRVQVEKADLTITQQVGDIGAGHCDRGAECIDKGREAAVEVLPRIKALLDAFKVRRVESQCVGS